MEVHLAAGRLTVGSGEFSFAPLPDKLLQILSAGGLVRMLSKAG